MTTPDLAAIVRKLTPAQRQYVETLQAPYGRGRWPVTNSLRAKGLMARLPHTMPTDLCLAVRAHLLSEKTDV